MRRKLPVVLSALYLSAPLVSAHHSVSAAYDRQAKPVIIKGEIVQLLYRNPHSFVHVIAPDRRGQTVRWSFEWANLNQLERFGITQETLKPGETVVVTGVPGRNPADNRALVRRIERPSDGWKWDGTFD